MSVSVNRIIEELSDPSSYPHHPDKVEIIQTHISVVFLAGDRVYKIKKPVDFGFLDFTTLDKREYFCRQELELNRRLSPDIYLDVTPVLERQGRLYFPPAGEAEDAGAVEFAVVMKRLDESRILANLMAGGKVDAAVVERIADRIAAFHSRCERSEEITRIGGTEAVQFNTEENFQQIEPYVGKTIDRTTFDLVRDYTRTFLAANRDLFKSREREGHIRDGHGDLHSQHICLTNGIQIFDCIEFNQRFRYADILCDAAFLGMDLDRLGYPDLASAYNERYLADAGQEGFRSLYNFYSCYRAVVRGKVEGFRSDDPSVSAQDADTAAASARAFFTLAAGYARHLSPPTLFVTCGLMGSGKSSLAGAISAKLDVTVLASDVVRKELAGIKPGDKRSVPFGQDIYHPALTEKTYRTLHARAAEHLSGGQSVVLDATYLDPSMRAQAAATAAATGSRLLLLFIEADKPTLVARLRARARGSSVSDGREEILGDQWAAFRAPAGEVPKETLVELDGKQGVGEWFSRVYHRALSTS